MRVLIAGGGTGGHLFPAVAVGEEILRQAPESTVLYAGASNGFEARWLPQHGLPCELMAVRGWTGKGPLTRLRALSEFVSAIAQARRLIRRFRPDLVLGAGGYVSAPFAVAAAASRVPLVLMEQNTRPGMTNRLMGRLADRICLGFADAAPSFAADRVVVSGNPVRFRWSGAAPRDSADPLQILVLGGSSGAHRLNLGVLKAFEIDAKSVINWRITHQTGEADQGMVAEGYARMRLAATVVPFIDDMASALRGADLVVARAGAMTVTEMALAGRPAIFVPYPFHRDRQQEFNARVLVRAGAARIVADDQQLGANLARELIELTADRAALLEMGRRAQATARPCAAATVAQVCFAVVRERRAA